MKNQPTNRKSLKLDIETLQHLDSNALDNVRGGEGQGQGQEEVGIRVGPTKEDHSCNPACGPAL